MAVVRMEFCCCDHLVSHLPLSASRCEVKAIHGFPSTVYILLPLTIVTWGTHHGSCPGLWQAWTKQDDLLTATIGHGEGWPGMHLGEVLHIRGLDVNNVERGRVDVQVPEIDAQVICRQKCLPVAAQADAVDVVGVRIAVHLAAP